MKRTAVLVLIILLAQPLFAQKDIAAIKKELVGKTYAYPYSIEIIQKYGQPETLQGTNNNVWRAYFPLGKFTMIMNKANDKITDVLAGRVPK